MVDCLAAMRPSSADSKVSPAQIGDAGNMPNGFYNAIQKCAFVYWCPQNPLSYSTPDLIF